VDGDELSSDKAWKVVVGGSDGNCPGWIGLLENEYGGVTASDPVHQLLLLAPPLVGNDNAGSMNRLSKSANSLPLFPTEHGI